jgi:hypothetical protein
MLAGLMSRCVMPAWKAKSSARVHLKMISTTRSTGSSGRPHNRFQRAAGDVFHDDVAEVVVDDGIVGLHDVRVRQLADERRFVEEQVGVELAALGVFQDAGKGDLDRHLALAKWSLPR